MKKGCVCILKDYMSLLTFTRLKDFSEFQWIALYLLFCV